MQAIVEKVLAAQRRYPASVPELSLHQLADATREVVPRIITAALDALERQQWRHGGQEAA